ncbi:MAG: exosortase/archaeosortase family protein [bacterium]|nr:exosortase/archaeosortase family protein [bacterium]
MSRANIREVALGVVITAVIAFGPLTPNELGPSLLIGAAVAGAVYFWRRRRHLPEEVGAEEPGNPKQPLGVMLLWAGLIALWAAAFWPTLRWMWSEWTRSVWANDHGIFMPFIMGYLVWSLLRNDVGSEPESSSWGLPILAVAATASILDAILGTRYLGMAGLLLSLPALSLLLVGIQRTRRLAVPLVLSLLMTPVPITLSTHMGLRYATASGVEPLLRLLGIPVLREDTVMRLSSGSFVVAEACSGFSTMYASIAVALILAFMARSKARKLTILLVAPFLALAANIARVLALVLIAHFVGQWTLETPIHEATGVGAFVIVLVGLFALARENPSEEAAS